MESLILAQNERWRRVLSMQVGRQHGGLPPCESGGLVSNTWVTDPPDGDSRQKCRVIPDTVPRVRSRGRKAAEAAPGGRPAAH